jgi:hypothetical protein
MRMPSSRLRADDATLITSIPTTMRHLPSRSNTPVIHMRARLRATTICLPSTRAHRRHASPSTSHICRHLSMSRQQCIHRPHSASRVTRDFSNDSRMSCSAREWRPHCYDRSRANTRQPRQHSITPAHIHRETATPRDVRHASDVRCVHPCARSLLSKSTSVEGSSFYVAAHTSFTQTR